MHTAVSVALYSDRLKILKRARDTVRKDGYLFLAFMSRTAGLELKQPKKIVKCLQILI